jgi:hypothetical protein
MTGKRKTPVSKPLPTKFPRVGDNENLVPPNFHIQLATQKQANNRKPLAPLDPVGTNLRQAQELVLDAAAQVVAQKLLQTDLREKEQQQLQPQLQQLQQRRRFNTLPTLSRVRIRVLVTHTHTHTHTHKHTRARARTRTHTSHYHPYLSGLASAPPV